MSIKCRILRNEQKGGKSLRGASFCFPFAGEWGPEGTLMLFDLRISSSSPEFSLFGSKRLPHQPTNTTWIIFSHFCSQHYYNHNIDELNFVNVFFSQHFPKWIITVAQSI